MWLFCHGVQAQEPPYFIAYSDVLEEPGNLEIATQNLYSTPKGANPFYAQTTEIEYGVTAWWTAETYLQGQVTAHDSTVFTGFRLENRFRPLRASHWVNPVLYAEYEDISADKSFLEVVGNDSVEDLQVPTGELRRSPERELEGKLILSSWWRGMNLSGNFIAEKNLAGDPWEFGYALGASHPMANAASAHCRFCRNDLSTGAELFGGLGTAHSFGLRSTSHYAGPTIQYTVPGNVTVLAGAEWGLNANSASVLWRLKVSYELNQIFRSER